MTTEMRGAAGFQFRIELDGRERKFHLGAIHHSVEARTSVYFIELSRGHNRSIFDIHVVATQWDPQKARGLEEICRVAIGQAERDGFFSFVQGEYEFDVSAPRWSGRLEQVQHPVPSALSKGAK